MLLNIQEWLFGLSLTINACLFIPQIIKLWQAKDSKEVSLLTFAGFNVIQLIGVWHGIDHKDAVFIFGELLGFAACGCVTFLIVYYAWKNRQKTLSCGVGLEQAAGVVKEVE